MRQIITLLAILTGITACNGDKTGMAENELIGTWKLISYCKPGGTITCNQVTVPTDKGVFISFTNDKKFNEYYQNTKPADYAFLGCGGGGYELEEDHIRIRASCMSSSNGQLYKLVSLTAKRLVMNPFGSGDYVFEKQ
ncbi:MAG: lipocalin family protein [Spirosomataceae bacterium]